MVDTDKLKKQAGIQGSPEETIDAVNEQVEKNLNLTADLPKVNSVGESSRAWMVRLVVGLFTVIALVILYFAYAESSKLRHREALVSREVVTAPELGERLELPLRSDRFDVLDAR